MAGEVGVAILPKLLKLCGRSRMFDFLEHPRQQRLHCFTGFCLCICINICMGLRIFYFPLESPRILRFRFFFVFFADFRVLVRMLVRMLLCFDFLRVMKRGAARQTIRCRGSH